MLLALHRAAPMSLRENLVSDTICFKVVADRTVADLFQGGNTQRQSCCGGPMPCVSSGRVPLWLVPCAMQNVLSDELLKAYLAKKAKEDPHATVSEQQKRSLTEDAVLAYLGEAAPVGGSPGAPSPVE